MNAAEIVTLPFRALAEAFWYPWVLTAAAIVPVYWWLYHRHARRAAIRFSGVAPLKAMSHGWSRRAAAILPALHCLALLLLVVAAARPRRADEQTRIEKEGIAIQLVLDRSGSMSEMDFVGADGRRGRRIDAIKQVVRDFIGGGGGDMQGRPTDLIGLIAFGTYADTECPLTSDHRHLLRALERLEPHMTQEEGQTAIGDALLLAVERIRDAGRRFKKDDAYTIKSRVIILLTDGDQTAGKYLPEEAAQAAVELGVKVYTVGAAPEFVERDMGIFFGGQRQRIPVEINEKPLRQVAEMTGGKFFRARDAQTLREIYAAIDELERSAIDETRYYLYHELAYNWIELSGLRLPPPLTVALALLALEVLLANTRFRRIP